MSTSLGRSLGSGTGATVATLSTTTVEVKAVQAPSPRLRSPQWVQGNVKGRPANFLTFLERCQMDQTLLTIHILSAAVWIGTGVFFMYAGPRFRQVGGPAVVGWIQVALTAIPRFISPTAILTVLSGITLVLVEEQWDWADGFVWIGLATFLVVLAIGLLWNAPNMRRAISALEAKEMPAVGTAMKRVSLGGLAMVALLVFAEFAMVFRIGAG